MKALISRENLFKAVQAVYPVVPSRSTLPILSHLLLETKKDALQVTGTDLEVGITTTVQAEVSEEGAISVPAKRLHDLLKELPNEALQIQAKKNQQLSLSCGKGSFKIVGLAREEFPRLPSAAGQESVVIDQGVLQAMISMTAFSVSRDESRYVLTGTLFCVKDGWLRLVATDGRRMAMVDREARSSSPQEHQWIVPEKTLNELMRLLGEGPTVKITFKENQIAFDLGNTLLISRLILEISVNEAR